MTDKHQFDTAMAYLLDHKWCPLELARMSHYAIVALAAHEQRRNGKMSKLIEQINEMGDL